MHSRGLILLLGIVVSCTTRVQSQLVNAAEDATLPTVNVKYEFGASDIKGGGPAMKSHAELLAFKKRIAHVVENVDKDAEVLSDFASRANNDLDELAKNLVMIRSLRKASDS